mmetsp:Transcript_14244/g.32349  ORF Transcript_14244/g.32349 Transcript_14244/m.32349 type:complete len:311 (-) Transcript_14244:72-1004(-)
MSKALFVVLPLAGAFTHNLIPHHTSERLQRVGSGLLEAGKHKLTSGAGLAFTHVPFNFGHTVEAVAAYPALSNDGKPKLSSEGVDQEAGGVAWGSAYPGLLNISDVTGCPLYLTPPKLWPEDLLAEYYTGAEEIFGILRDPYERLVAMFRGGMSDYGGPFNMSLLASCSIDQGIREMLDAYLHGGNPYLAGCALLPQAEFFEGDYGITLPVDNRLFPHSANAVFEEYRYPFRISQDRILHVTSCQDAWTADLSPETKALIRQVYARDFELLCAHFGYCETAEDTCLTFVNGMCPETVFAWNATAEMYVKR